MFSSYLSVVSRFQRVGWVSRRRNPSKQQLLLILLDSCVLQNDGLRRWLTHPTTFIATVNWYIANRYGYVLIKCCYFRNQVFSSYLSVVSRFQRVGWVSRRRNPSKQQLLLILLDSCALQNDGLRRWLTHPTTFIATLNWYIANRYN